MPILRANNLSKQYASSRERRSALGVLGGLLTFGREPTKERFALRGISFEVDSGVMIGLIGNNGSGKTTLLKVLGGLHQPTSGTVELHGEPIYLAGLGLGMLNRLTVKENVFLYGAIYGMHRSVIREQLASILEWADLEPYADAKLRTLSSGMRTRLAFSTARFIEADLCLYDEVMSAGDQNFREKCDRVFEDFRASGRTSILCSHNLKFVQTLCDRVLWLHKGRMMAFDGAERVVEQYEALRGSTHIEAAGAKDK